MRDVDLFFDFVGFAGPFDETTELARWTAKASGPNPHVEMQGDGTIDVAFDLTTGVAAGRPVLATLDELKNYVSNIVGVLKIKGLEGIAL